MKREPEAIEGPVAILGWGVSGQGAARLLRKQNLDFDAFEEGGRSITRGVFSRREAQQYPTVVVSPGFDRAHPWLELAREEGCRILSEIDLAARYWDGQIVMVTGTNGKTSLCTLLAAAFQQAGVAAVTAGNIGRSFAEVCAEAEQPHPVAVCEVSSFQAEGMGELKADALLWTNFDEDHLDRHPSLEAYFRAKWHLLEHLRQGQFLFGPTVGEAAREFGLEIPSWGTQIETRGFSKDYFPAPFARRNQQENYRLAEAFWQANEYSLEALREAANRFEAPRFRLEPVAVEDEAQWWNDSKSTNFHATLYALRAVDGPVIWIGGGRAKGGDIQAFAHAVAERVEQSFVYGEVGDELARSLTACDSQVQRCEDLENAVELAARCVPAGGAVVFSPAFSSLDEFDSYFERGLRFEAAVFHLKESSRQISAPGRESAQS